MNTPTPETDAMEVDFNPYTVPADFARNLECERDEYKKLLSETLKSDMPVVERLLLERDQLRKVCDELALMIDPFEYGELTSYNSLPHVIAAKKGKTE